MFAGLYGLGIQLARLIVRVWALFNPKTKKAVLGRRKEIKMPKLDPGRKVVWMHCASLGEFEQGKPLIEKIKGTYPDVFSVLSFFSPSGYEQAIHYKHADLVCYLPFDTYSGAHSFIRSIQPDLAVFVKYEFWYNHLRVLNRLNIPTLFISVALRPGHFLLHGFGKPILRELSKINAIFTQNEETARLLGAKGLLNVIRSGDTRVDSVHAIRKSHSEDPLVGGFAHRSEKPVIIVGSAWKKDIDVMAGMDRQITRQFRWIIAPHEIGEEQVRYVESGFNFLNPSRYSGGDVDPKCELLVIDTIGKLKYLYRYADLVFIGGGFGGGIHNTLEPAVYGKVVLFGPRYLKFQEAVALVEKKGFFPVRHSRELSQMLLFLKDPQVRHEKSKIIETYMTENRHSVDGILSYLESGSYL